MGVAVINPSDCLQDGFTRHRRLISPPRSHLRRIPGNQTHAGNRRRKQNRSPVGSPPPPSHPPSKPSVNDGRSHRAKSPSLVMGEVRILRRGDDISAPALKSLSSAQQTKPKASRTLSKSPEPKSSPTPAKILEPKRQVLVEVKNDFALNPVDGSQVEELSVPLPPLFLNGFYAGSGFAISPPPSSVPVPAFCTKKAAPVNDVALDLRRILRLE